MKKDTLIVILLTLIVINTITLLAIVLWGNKQQPIIIEQGLATYFNANEIYIK